MRGRVNMNGVLEGGFTVPDNEYLTEITEKIDKTSKNGDPMVSVKLTIKRGEYKGMWIWDNILIPSPESPSAKILSRTKHFLRCINEPYEGEDVIWDSDKWLGKTCYVITGIEDPNEYHKNSKNIIREYFLPKETEEPPTLSNEEIPF